jgi:hypothetical protein
MKYTWIVEHLERVAEYSVAVGKYPELVVEYPKRRRVLGRVRVVRAVHRALQLM